MVPTDHTANPNNSHIFRANQLLEETAPWAALKKGTDEQKVAAHVTLVAALEGTRIAAVMLSPVVPELSQKIHAQLGLDVDVQVCLCSCSSLVFLCTFYLRDVLMFIEHAH